MSSQNTFKNDIHFVKIRALYVLNQNGRRKITRSSVKRLENGGLLRFYQFVIPSPPSPTQFVGAPQSKDNPEERRKFRIFVCGEWGFKRLITNRHFSFPLRTSPLSEPHTESMRCRGRK